MVTFTTGAAYDPKVHTLIDILNYTQIITQKTDNEYEVNVYEWLDESPIKRWFRPGIHAPEPGAPKHFQILAPHRT